jgi:hypothetical protein
MRGEKAPGNFKSFPEFNWLRNSFLFSNGLVVPKSIAELHFLPEGVRKFLFHHAYY